MDYKEVIESKYNRQNWQLLLHDIFGNKIKFWNTPSVVPTSSQFAKQALWLGTITLSDEQTISVYEVELSDSVDIERNRRGIRDMLLTDWRNNGNAGAFMFCYRKNESVLRFSYVSEAWKFAEDGTYQKESTDAKRFTYLLGEGHRSRTAIQQFEALRDSALSLKDLTKAFSVDAVSDMFFKEYKKNYEDIIFYVTGKRMVKVANKWEERQEGEPCEEIMQEFSAFANPEKAVRDYVKKLMGRLVFLQFLQKKGWLGVRANAEWGTGDTEFIQNLFAQTKDKDHFIDNVLESLFNDLNSEDEKKLPQYRTPYLNGGLFEREAADETNFPLPAKYMQQMLDFFSSYNFTIDENDPDDAEVGVDPEMLGRIFENLLEDNKDKGAFYTPKEIVTYMCRESLIAYLQTDVDDEATKDAIRLFVTTHDAATLGNIADDIDQRLKDVKICDPAIGSGAFPMGLLKELFLCRTALEGISQHQVAEIKKHIIQNNIYGVDLEKGAVDIARLRFWLSLIVDEETPQALPNLDFKIMRGDSLLEQYNGFNLSTIMHNKKKVEGPVQMSFFEDDIDVLRRQVIGLRREYYRETNKQKKKNLRKQMRDIVQQQINTLSYNIDLSGIDIADNSKFFLWHTWFADVFEEGGFDIVIGNPPYVQLQNNGGELAQMYETSEFKTFARTGDIYCLFYELGWQLLKHGGHLCFITSNKWMRAGYGEKTREFFATKTNPMLLIDFAGVKIFESATVDTNILLFAKSDNKHETKCAVTTKEDKDSIKNLSDFVQQQNNICDFSTCDCWVILSPIEQSIKRKIESVGIPLKDWNINIYRGVLTGYNDAFIINTEKRDEILANCQTEEERKKTAELIRPILRGRDIKRYGYVNNGLFLINSHNGVRGKFPRIDINDYPAVKAHLDKFWNKISVRADKGDTPYNLRNCAYLEDFDKPKIVYPETTQGAYFAYDTSGIFIDKTCFMLMSKDSHYLQMTLSSRLFEFAYKKIFSSVELGEHGYQYNKHALVKLPVIKNKDVARQLSDVENKQEIDRIIYHLYGLTYDEVLIIDPTPPFTKEEYEQDI